MTLTEQVEILKEARAGLHMWNMDTTGIDKMLEQHGVDVSALPQHSEHHFTDVNQQGSGQAI